MLISALGFEVRHEVVEPADGGLPFPDGSMGNHEVPGRVECVVELRAGTGRRVDDEDVVLLVDTFLAQDALELGPHRERLAEVAPGFLLLPERFAQVLEAVVFGDDVDAVLDGPDQVRELAHPPADEVVNERVDVAVRPVVVSVEQVTQVAVLRVERDHEDVEPGASVRDSEVRGERRLPDPTGLAVHRIREHTVRFDPSSISFRQTFQFNVPRTPNNRL